MANSDKDILITPNSGSSSADPKIEYVGANSSGNDTITVEALYDGTKATLSFEGSAGQLFSVVNDLSSDPIFSVNDVSGIPSIEVDSDGEIRLAEFSGNVGIGISAPTELLHVDGRIKANNLTLASLSAQNSEATAVMIDGSGIIGTRELGSNAFNSTSYLTGNQTITLSGDVSGSGTTSISVTVADDSHNHVISNVDGLQTALDAKAPVSTTVTTNGTQSISGAKTFTTTLALSSGQKLTLKDANHYVQYLSTGFSGSTIDGPVVVGHQGGELGTNISSNQYSLRWDSAGNIIARNDGYFNGTKLEGDNKEMIRYSDSWLRLNPANEFTSGIYLGSGIIRTDGQFQVGSSGSQFKIESNGNTTVNGTVNLNERVNIGNSVTRPSALNSDSVAQARIGGSDVYLYVASLNATGGYDVAVQAARASDFASFDLNLQSNGGNLQRAGNKVWDAGNDGSGSGLDADLLDGINSTSFARVDAGNNYTNYANNNHFYSNTNIATSSGNQASLEVYGGGGTGTDAFMTFHVGSDFACYFGLDGGTNKLSVGGWSMGANSYEIYHSGNKPTLAALGYTGATNANYITNNNQLTNGAGYLTSFTETNAFLGDGGNASTHPGTGRVIYSGQVSAGTSVLGMPTTNNANAFLNLNKHSGEYNSQLGFSSNGNIYYRNFNNTAINSTATWRTIWDSGNDGSGSGLDADTVDGIQGASFLRSDANDSSTGVLTLQPSANRTLILDRNIASPSNYYNDLQMEVRATSGTAGIGLHRNGYSHVGIYTNTSNRLDFDFNSGDVILYHNAGTLWGSGNDGAGSGLDADTLDSVQASSFLRSDANDTYTGTLSVAGTIQDSGDSREIRLMSGTTSSQPAIGVGEQGLFGMKMRWDSGSRIEFDGFWSTSVTGSRNRDLGSINVNTAVWELPSGVTINGSTAWHAGNDGSGSGLDADLLDGQHGSYYAPTASPTFTGTLTNAGTLSTAANQHSMTTPHGYIQIGPMNTSWAHIYTDRSNFYFNKQLYVLGDKVWNAGNDGSGSGLDADTLDGYNAEEGAVNNSIVKRDGTASIKAFGLSLLRQSTARTGITWYNESYYNWQDYMASAGVTGCGPNGNLTAPTGLAGVTSWALRSRMEGVSTYGWNWETGSGGGGGATATSKMSLNATTGNLQIAGSLTAGADVIAYSDEKLKDDVQVIENAVEKVKQVRGVTFTRNDLEDQERHAGVIAQEVEKVLPEVVGYDEDRDTKTVAYGNMVGLLIEAIKEQQETIEKLTSRINDIEKGE